MKLGTKTRCGARALLALALNCEDGNGVVSAKEMADCQQVSARYLVHLLASHRWAGLVRNVRGAQGRHRLARPSDEINLLEVYDVFQGTDGYVECATYPEQCDRADVCVTGEVWSRLYSAAMEILKSTTLADLVGRAGVNRDAAAGG